jgi:FkbM family methyltransferase
MTLARQTVQAARAALRGVGMDLTTSRNARRQFSGVTIAWGAPDKNALRGTIMRVDTGSGRYVRFFVANENDEIQREHRSGLFYEPEELAIIARHYRGSTFLDVGSNVGNHAVYAATVMNAPKVICVEPNPVAAEVLELNLLLNDLRARTEILRCGFSSRAVQAHIGWSPAGNLGATHFVEGSGPVSMVRGDDVVQGDVGFIKIDAEGFELDVLAGLETTIARCRPPIFVEVDQPNQNAFMKLIDRLDYRIADSFERYDDAPNFLLEPAP